MLSVFFFSGTSAVNTQHNTCSPLKRLEFRGATHYEQWLCVLLGLTLQLSMQIAVSQCSIYSIGILYYSRCRVRVAGAGGRRQMLALHVSACASGLGNDARQRAAVLDAGGDRVLERHSCQVLALRPPGWRGGSCPSVLFCFISILICGLFFLFHMPSLRISDR